MLCCLLKVSVQRLIGSAFVQVFNEFEDDQFDFHGYSLRRFTLNVYLKYV